ncbi:MAG: tRNA (adenine-N(6)-)-methyltransferase [Lutibacter sp.]|nr:MAG: tRNA (adenine-N(6)-)-methyltransferase [Lutibacter sp.]
MKIGTDAVLLGSWTQLNSPYSVLDIGTGTGIIALQIAQRSFAENIDAIEIEANAFEQAVENFEASDWSDRLFCYHASLQDFVDEIDDKYDLIVSNPPFYTSTYKKEEIEAKRAMARHSESLPYGFLLNSTEKMLSENGSCAFIIPFEEEEQFLKKASENKLFPFRISRVRGTEKSIIKRSLLQLSFKEIIIEIDELIIEIERHKYTQEYINLTQDFYLKM